MSFKKFINRNLVAITIVPTIVAIHYTVDRIQYNEKLVAEHERKDLPIVLAYKSVKEKILGAESSESMQIENQKES